MHQGSYNDDYENDESNSRALAREMDIVRWA
jgi:hypothetical protein